MNYNNMSLNNPEDGLTSSKYETGDPDCQEQNLRKSLYNNLKPHRKR
jgi:hypothetical protein